MRLYCALAVFIISFVSANDHNIINAKLLRETKPLKLKYCFGLGYNVTSKMNFFQQKDPLVISRSTLFRRMRSLAWAGCSKMLRRYMCALFAPEVLNTSVGVLPPCRATCKNIENSCASILQTISALRQARKGGCKNTKMGEDYRGSKATTARGFTCQRWDVHTPHSHPHVTAETYPDEGLESNYCRNPDGEDDGPWCYTTSKERKWDSCGIPLCRATLKCELLPDPTSRTGCMDFKYDKESRRFVGFIKGNPTEWQRDQFLSSSIPDASELP